MRLGLNRWDWRSPEHFVESVLAGEAAGVLADARAAGAVDAGAEGEVVRVHHLADERGAHAPAGADDDDRDHA